MEHVSYKSDFTADLETSRAWLQKFGHILVAAGAGMSTEAGNDYLDAEAFKKRFPGMAKRGYRYPYELVGKKDWDSPQFQWGYMAAFINLTRFNLPPHHIYGDLLTLIKQKDYFVITSNVDGMFVLNGYDSTRIYTPQGDFENMQCRNACTDPWKSKPVIDKILPSIDHETQEITDHSLIPKCPKCGGPVAPNVNFGKAYQHKPYEQQEAAFKAWVTKAIEAKDLVIVEVGAGFNTPTVIRFRMESIAYHTKEFSKLIRINREYPQLPEELEESAVGLPLSFSEVLDTWKTVK